MVAIRAHFSNPVRNNEKNNWSILGSLYVLNRINTQIGLPTNEYVYSPQRQNTNQINTAYRNKTETKQKNTHQWTVESIKSKAKLTLQIEICSILAVTLVGGENGYALCLWKVTAKNVFLQRWIGPTIILILHFPFSKYNRNILGFIFDIIPLCNCHFCFNVHFYIGSYYFI